jgi:tetratricopeptide (TPR) repeat protein
MAIPTDPRDCLPPRLPADFEQPPLPVPVSPAAPRDLCDLLPPFLRRYCPDQQQCRLWAAKCRSVLYDWLARFGKACARGWSALDRRGRLFVVGGAFAAVALLLFAIGVLAHKPGEEAFDKGMAAWNKGTLDEAIVDFTEAIRLNPTSDAAYQTRGCVYNAKGKRDLAIADLTEAIRLHPNWALAYANRGLAYAGKHEWQLAITDCSEAIRLNPNDNLAYSHRGLAQLGLAHAGKGSWDLEILRLANSQNYANRGSAQMGKRRWDEAIADFVEAIRLDPKYGRGYVLRARAHAPKGDWNEVIADCTEAIRLDPRDAVAYAVRACGYKEKGEGDKARNDFDRAEELGISPDWPD